MRLYDGVVRGRVLGGKGARRGEVRYAEDLDRGTPYTQVDCTKDR